MGETAYTGLHRTFQEEENIYAVRCHGKDSKTTSLSANSNSDCMGCSSITLDNLHHENEGFRGNGASRPEKVSLQDASYLGRQNYDDEYEKSVSPISSKCNDFGGKGEHKIYVREFNPHVRKEQLVNSTVEGEFYTDTTVVPFECCPNKQRIRSLLPYLGKLRRNGTLAGHAWTKEEPKTPCRLVVPDIQCVRERISKTMSPVPEGEEQDEYREVSNNSKNPLMIVEMIANKLDRKRVAESLNCKLEGGEPSSCICYMEDVKEYYDFDHIIIIGKIHAGIIFLDCYGRVFVWESMNYVLWLLGDYCNEATKNSRPVWGLDFDGSIVKFDEVVINTKEEDSSKKKESSKKKKSSKRKKSSKKK